MPPKKETPKKEAPKMTWKSHLAEVYAAGKKKDSSYKYSQAMINTMPIMIKEQIYHLSKSF
jgi:hypothetical protein